MENNNGDIAKLLDNKDNVVSSGLA